MKTPRIAIIVPCLNEEEVVKTTAGRLSALLKEMESAGKASPESFIMFVDDGSSDQTWEKISTVSSEKTRGIKLSRNFGHQEAILAGIEEALPFCDAIISIDADLQDDIDVIPGMVKEFGNGADIVFGVRNDRSRDSLFKRTTAKWFYSTMRSLGVHTVTDHADFRLMSSRAAANLLEFEERNLFLRGIVPMLGYTQSTVTYERKERNGGKTKYPLAKMFEFAINGITSFSVRPVRMLFWIGTLFMLTALGVGVYVMIRYITGETIEGWTSLILSIWFCTGILLMGLGIIGEYIGKIYIEVKKRPRYKVIDSTTSRQPTSNDQRPTTND